MKRAIMVLWLVLLLSLLTACKAQGDFVQEKYPVSSYVELTPDVSPTPSVAPETSEPPTPMPSVTLAPVIEPIPSAVPKIDISELNPVVCDWLLLGGSDSKRWLRPDEVIESLREGETFKLYSLDGYLGDGIGEKVSYDNFFGIESVEIEHSVKDVEFIAVGCDWDCMPRKPVAMSNDNQVYTNIVKDILAENGLENAIAEIVQIYKIDLEGDGIDEVVIYAEHIDGGSIINAENADKDWWIYSYPEHWYFRPDKGEYSLLLLRKVVGGEVKNIILNMQLDNGRVTDNMHDDLRFTFGICGFLDLNGDGKLELISSWRYYEGKGYNVYEIINDDADRVIGNGWET